MAEIPNSLNNSIQNKLTELSDRFKLNQLAISNLESPLHFDFYQKWIAKGFHSSMSYLATHAPLKENPKLINPELKSVISVAQSYFPLTQPHPTKIPARIALYAQNEDYHHWLKEKLILILEELKKTYPDNIFLPFVDSGPISERDLAYKNGLGWFGKNTCLIHPKFGSFFFIAEILTDLSLQTSAFELVPDFCGNCQRCMEICPTHAIISPRELKADQCISFLTIEAKTPPPMQLREKIGDWFFGCDLCQTVCPWNEKVLRIKKIENTHATSILPRLNINENERAEILKYFEFLLTASNKKIQKYHFGSPLSRAGANGLKRNALIVIANQNLFELKSVVENFEFADLSELKTWTLSKIKNPKL